MSKTKNIAYIGVLTALYAVAALTLKVHFGVGDIALDLGYIVLTIACMHFGWQGAIVGGLGALLESILFSAYGISYGWIVMNIIIGVICGLIFTKYKSHKYKFVVFIITIIIAVFIGAAVKTAIECSLYSIPYVVKIPKSALAWIVDSIVMIIGLPIADRLKSAIKVNR